MRSITAYGKSLTRSLAYAIAYLAIAPRVASADAINDLQPPAVLWQGGDFLFPGQSIASTNCYYHADMQYDGNFVLYAGPGTGNPKWATGTAGMRNPPEYCSPYYNRHYNDPVGATMCPTGICCGAKMTTDDYKYVQMQGDGRFIVARRWHWYTYSTSGRDVDAQWAGGDVNHPGSYLTVERAGNMILRDWYGNWFWSTNTGGNPKPDMYPCPIVSQTTRVEGSVDRPGSDYSYTPWVNMWQDCARNCVRDPNCKAFTSELAGQHGCWLKNSVPAGVSRSGFYSGWIRNK